jgi:spermidine/putrescine transport system permease protein
MTAAAEGSASSAARRRRSGKALLQSESFQGLALISPTLLYALVLLVTPILVVIAHSFWSQHYLTIDRTFTLENYRIALTEPIYRDLLWRSLTISLLVSLFTVVLAYPIAYFISFHGGRRKGLWLFLITIPFWTSYLLRVMSWKVILGYNGVLNSALMCLGITSEPSTALLYNSSAVIITLTHAWAAFAILPIFVSLEKVDRTLVEAATDLGDGPLRSFLRVTLPLSAPGVISALLIVMIPTVGDYVTPKLVGGKDGVMIANAIQAQFGKAANWPLGAALSVTTMVVVSLMAGAAVFIIRSAVRLAR